MTHGAPLSLVVPEVEGEIESVLNMNIPKGEARVEIVLDAAIIMSPLIVLIWISVKGSTISTTRMPARKGGDPQVEIVVETDDEGTPSLSENENEKRNPSANVSESGNVSVKERERENDI